uniref:Amiloride-sensitive sodium channel n=1 Tax=Macrostomum lignano TaxID=282301 RepID=A0A1I8IT13_9PLAT
MLFCECSSIRGMPKIARSSSNFLRKMWLTFVVVMTLVLIVSASLSVRSYLQYDVIVHISDIQNQRSPFPAITVCLHQPFSNRAFKLWANRSVLSPREYNKLLRKWAISIINRTEDFSTIGSTDPISYALYYDMLEVYYQNIQLRDITVLSHEPSVIRKCILKNSGGMSYFKDPCNLTEYGFSTKLFSHPKHLNCYTVEPSNPISSIETYFLGMAVDLGPKPDYANFQQGFLNDVFDQATGLRVVIHEPNRYPNVEHFGMNVESGKMTELAYTPTLWNRSNTPVNPCILSGESFKDLGREFWYTQRECTNKHIQDQVMARCNCIIGLPGFPRPKTPSIALPYCASFTRAYNKTFDDFLNQLNCYVGVLESLTEANCLPRCILTEYETKPSVTYWGATDWQVYWSGKFVNDIEDLSSLIQDRDERAKPLPELRERFGAVKSRLMRYLTQENLTTVGDADGQVEDMVESKNFAYVVLKRKSENLVLKEEKQVLTLNALMSQIGGLCSLTIGLTCAFVVEIVEFFYIYTTRAASKQPASAAGGPADCSTVANAAAGAALLNDSANSRQPQPLQPPLQQQQQRYRRVCATEL